MKALHNNKVECIADPVAGDLKLLIASSPEQLEEFRTALNRALGCWENAPPWLLALADALETNPVPALVGKTV